MIKLNPDKSETKYSAEKHELTEDGKRKGEEKRYRKRERESLRKRSLNQGSSQRIPSLRLTALPENQGLEISGGRATLPSPQTFASMSGPASH